MKRDSASFVGRMRGRQRGQALAMIPVLLISLIGAAALVVDIGILYYAYQELVGATDAAALAGAAAISNGTATTVATQYSAASGDLNSHTILQIGKVTANLVCLTATGIGLPPCMVYGSQSSANAIVVTEQATVPTFFAKIFGIKSFNISSTATAAKGGGVRPYNVLIVLDTTNSMTHTDSDSQCNNTRLSCAQAGIQTLLKGLDPCPLADPSCVTGSETSGNANVTNALDEVGLMAFPGLTPSESSTLSSPPVAAPTASDDYTCPTSNPSITSYNGNPGYLILSLGSNYRTSNTSTSLNSTSDMAIATGAGSCSGVKAPGGEGTFYAGVIAAAQSYLEANSRSNTANVMVLLSDGDAGNGKMGGSATTYATTAQCQQAVTAANTAKAAGITIYAVAYGAEASGCADTGDTLTPCETMEDIAGSPSASSPPSSSPYFFSDYTATGGTNTCVSASRPTTSLNEIFTEIYEDLTVARLLPNNTP
jgi:Flp pilus assembly protein TadG